MEQDPSILTLFQAQTASAARLRASSASERIGRLRSLERAMFSFEAEIKQALLDDFGKGTEEVLLTEIAPVIIEIRHARRRLRSWMKPRRVGRPLALAGTASHVRYEGKGPSLIISPWNYAFTLTLGPVVAAVAAGCPVFVKPSELTPAATIVLRKILESVFPADEVVVLAGGPDVAERLLELPFRHIYFTGSTEIGRKVMGAAARHLASVTLELGGKSPAVVEATSDIEQTTRRLVFGKYANAGQTCIAPDYALVDSRIADVFVRAFVESKERLFGDTESFAQNPHAFCRIISTRHTARIKEMLEEALQGGSSVVAGALTDVNRRHVSPTVVAGLSPDARLMKEEIFGPVLPVVVYSNEAELHELLAAQPPPLTAYVFSRDEPFIRRFIADAEAGSVVVNETLLHFANPHLPFGGLGASGMGRGHGYAGFLAFSNEKSVLRRRGNAWMLRRIYPPYTRSTLKWLRALIRFS